VAQGFRNHSSLGCSVPATLGEKAMTRIVVLVLALMFLGLSAVALWVTTTPASESGPRRSTKLRTWFARSDVRYPQRKQAANATG
jgi:hypothetical protein